MPFDPLILIIAVIVVFLVALIRGFGSAAGVGILSWLKKKVCPPALPDPKPLPVDHLMENMPESIRQQIEDLTSRGVYI